MLEISALIAILTAEPDAGALLELLVAASVRRISAGNYIELAVVIASQHGPEMSRQSDAFLHRAQVLVEPVTLEQAETARQAFLDYGRGRHPARLNFG